MDEAMLILTHAMLTAAQRLTRRKVWVWRRGNEDGAGVRKGRVRGCVRRMKKNRERRKTKVVSMELLVGSCL